MNQLVFDQRRAPETLIQLLDTLLQQWLDLPPAVRQQIDEQRRRLRQALPTLPALQRSGRVIALLQELEAIPAVAAIGGAILQAGKGPSMRMIAQLSDEQVRDLLNVLARPAPAEPDTAAAPVQVVAFQLHVNVLDKVTGDGALPVVIYLTPDTRPAEQQVDAILIPFADLRQPVIVDVLLSAPALRETSSAWLRAIAVYAVGRSLPAVYLLATDGSMGRQSLQVYFYQALGNAVRVIDIQSPHEAKSVAPALPAAGPTRGLSSADAVDYYTDIRFADQLLRQTLQPLLIRLTLEQSKTSAVTGKASVAFADPRQAELIEVILNAPPELSERTESNRRVLRLFRQTDSQPAVFLLQAGDQLGPHRLSIDFYHRGRLILNVELTSEIVDQLTPPAAGGPQQKTAPALDDLVANPPPPPDLELRIYYDPATRRMNFQLHAEQAELGYQRRDMGEIRLAADPSQFLEQRFLHLSELAVRTVESLSEDDSAVQTDELTVIGQGLFAELFPPALQKEYWRLKALREAGQLRSLVIISDEPWAPWELIKPFWYDETQDQVHEDGFLAETFELARWLPKRGLAPDVDVSAARLVAPALNLAYSELERQFFAGLQQKGLDVGQPLGLRTEVLATLQSARIKLLHLAAHGNVRHENINESPLELDNREYLRPSDLVGQRTVALRRERPLVFLNACHSGQIGFALTGLGGWAEKMVGDIGVSAFVGTLWEVNDLLAAKFAIRFYEQLMAGQTLGQAFQAARRYIHQLAPANSTWLAYTLYADPNARVSWRGLQA